MIAIEEKETRCYNVTELLRFYFERMLSMKKTRDYSENNSREWEDYEEQEYDWDRQEEENDELYDDDGEMEFAAEEESFAGGEELEFADGEFAGEEFTEYDEEYAEEENSDYYGEEEAFDAEADYYEAESDADYYGFEAGEEEDYDPSAGEYAAEEYAYEAEDGYGEAPDREEYAVYGTKSKAGTGRRQGGGQPQPQEGFFAKVGRMLRSMDTMDRIMVGTGVGVLILAIVTVSIFLSTRTVERQVSDFASVGAQLNGIETIGERGLLAVADAELAKLTAASIVDEETDDQRGEYNESGYEREVKVELNFTSIQKDLKIKFVNKRTGKLVPNVPFSVTVTDPDNKSQIWSDDDMDGIIYKKDIKPGTYKVAMEELTDSRYKDYIISTTSQSVEVKKEISYNKVDVSNEVKTESEINASKEDTKKNETTVESALEDTVKWVASNKIPASYNEVQKNTIPDPMTLAALSKSFLRMSESTETPTVPTDTPPETTDPTTSTDPTEPTDPGTSESPETPVLTQGTVTVAPSALTGTVGDTLTAKATAAGFTPEQTLSYGEISSTNSNVATASIDGNGNITVNAVSAGTTTLIGTVDYKDNPGYSVSYSVEVTVNDPAPTLAKGTVTVDSAALTGSAGTTLSAKATAKDFTQTDQGLEYKIVSSQPAIATASIDGNGTIAVQALTAGTTKLTITVDYKSKPEGTTATAAVAEITVTVTGKKTLTLDKTALTAFVQNPAVFNAVIANAGVQNPAVKATSSDTNIAVVQVNGLQITVTGVAAGSAIITVEYTEGTEVLKATCTVTVKANPKEDKTNKLKDNAGRQVYVLENGKYREAVYADYYTASKFYLAGEAKYTGWQTIDGKVYFFKEDGTKVTGEQTIQGAKYNFASDGSMITGSNGIVGIDVSKWNGTIDWNAVKNSGISYVIIRCGYRGSSEGTLVVDPKYEANIKGASAAGLKVGVYFFTQAINEVETVEEASMVLELVKNYKLSYPIFLDVEGSGGRGDKIDKATRTAVCKAFCQTIQNSGYTAGIYANKSWLETKIDADSLSSYKIWLAQYAAAPTYKGRYNIWQYRSTGNVSGISGNVDMNISYLGY